MGRSICVTPQKPRSTMSTTMDCLYMAPVMMEPTPSTMAVCLTFLQSGVRNMSAAYMPIMSNPTYEAILMRNA